MCSAITIAVPAIWADLWAFVAILHGLQFVPPNSKIEFFQTKKVGLKPHLS
jgi:hypothetical protein